MTAVFADTFYYLALLNRRDDAHSRVVDLTRRLNGRIVTTDGVLTELADGLSRSSTRGTAADFIKRLRANPLVSVVAGERDLFDRGLDLYIRREDKNWSLTDCISFVVMRDRGLSQALTADHHFEQAGFVALLK